MGSLGLGVDCSTYSSGCWKSSKPSLPQPSSSLTVASGCFNVSFFYSSCSSSLISGFSTGSAGDAKSRPSSRLITGFDATGFDVCILIIFIRSSRLETLVVVSILLIGLFYSSSATFTSSSFESCSVFSISITGKSTSFGSTNSSKSPQSSSAAADLRSSDGSFSSYGVIWMIGYCLISVDSWTGSSKSPHSSVASSSELA